MSRLPFIICLFFLSSKHGSILVLPLKRFFLLPFAAPLSSCFAIITPDQVHAHGIPSHPSWFFFSLYIFDLIGVYAKTRIVCDVSCRAYRAASCCAGMWI